MITFCSVVVISSIINPQLHQLFPGGCGKAQHTQVTLLGSKDCMSVTANWKEQSRSHFLDLQQKNIKKSQVHYYYYSLQCCVGWVKEYVKAERVSNCLPLRGRDVSKLSSNMEHAYFLAPEKLRFLQSKPPHTCGIRHVKENVLCQPGCAYRLTRACSSALAAWL